MSILKKSLLRLFPIQPSVERFVVDFEAGLWQGLSSVFGEPQTSMVELSIGDRQCDVKSNSCDFRCITYDSSHLFLTGAFDYRNGPEWVPGLLGPKPFRPGTPRPGRFGPLFHPGLLGPLCWDRSAHFIIIIIFFLWGGGEGDNSLLYSVYVHQTRVKKLFKT